jgi:hypothetical protein
MDNDRSCNQSETGEENPGASNVSDAITLPLLCQSLTSPQRSGQSSTRKRQHQHSVDRAYRHKKVRISRTPPQPSSEKGPPATPTGNEAASDCASSKITGMWTVSRSRANLLRNRSLAIQTNIITDNVPRSVSVNDSEDPSLGFKANPQKNSPQAIQTETDMEFTGDSERSESPNSLSDPPSRPPMNLDFRTAVSAVISERNVQGICNGQLVQFTVPWEMSDDRVTVWVNCSFILQQ